MFFRGYSDSFLGLLTFKKSDQAIRNKLCGNRSADQFRELGSTNRKILLDLHDPYPLSSAFGLNWQDIVGAPLINTNVDFIHLDLADARRSCSQMILQRIASKASENIDEAIVPNLGQQRLLVAQGVLADYSWGGIWNLRIRQDV
jgi:hypothetical protein